MMNTKDRKRTQSTARPPRRRRKPDNRPSKAPELQVQYTPAKTFNRNRFLLQLATVAAIVLALVLGMSIFFKVSQINVAGTQKYTPWHIREASGIQTGEALLSLNEAKICANIREKLPYVGDVRVGIKLPDTVVIEIKELEVVYSVEDVNGAWWLLDVTGRVVDQINAAAAENHTKILGVRIHSAQIGQPAKAAETKTEASTPVESGTTTPTLPPIPAEERLNSVVQVLAALESKSVMGTVVQSVDVSDRETIRLWYDNRFLVSLGDTSRLDYKVEAMKETIARLSQYETGILDVSFTIWPDKVHREDFDANSGIKK